MLHRAGLPLSFQISLKNLNLLQNGRFGRILTYIRITCIVHEVVDCLIYFDRIQFFLFFSVFCIYILNCTFQMSYFFCDIVTF